MGTEHFYIFCCVVVVCITIYLIVCRCIENDAYQQERERQERRERDKRFEVHL